MARCFLIELEFEEGTALARPGPSLAGRPGPLIRPGPHAAKSLLALDPSLAPSLHPMILTLIRPSPDFPR